MEHPTATTVVLVGDDAGAALGQLDGFANVRSASLAGRTDEEVTAWTASSSTPYVLHDHDPLQHVASAWAEFYDDLATLGVLELEIERTVDALDREAIAIPDYYVVLDPYALAPTVRHWWLGVIASASPMRVIPWGSEADASLAGLLRHLPTGRPWPEPSTWLPGVVTAVPDRVGLGD